MSDSNPIAALVGSALALGLCVVVGNSATALHFVQRVGAVMAP